MEAVALYALSGGGGGIRTHEGLSSLPVFKTGAFNHSATPPVLKLAAFFSPNHRISTLPKPRWNASGATDTAVEVLDQPGRGERWDVFDA
jgi:hypothetical protein